MKRTVLDFGLVGLLAMALVAGCSSSGGSASGSGGSSGNGSGGNNNSSSGGSNGSGGSSNGSGGSSSGSGGSSSGSGGDSGGGSGGSSGSSSCMAITTDLITDFGSNTQVGSTPYSGAESDLTPPKVTISDGSLVIMLDSGTSTMMYPYAYAGMSFPSCVDASAYTGVKFTISGTISDMCTIQFSTVDKEHNEPSNNGTCDKTMTSGGSCYASSKIFTLPSDPTDVTVAFTDQMNGGAAATAAQVDPTQILGIQWQLSPPAMGSCTAMVTIKNVTFVK